MFKHLGQFVCGRPLVCIVGWVLLAVCLGALAPDEDRLRFSEPESLVPADSAFNRSMAAQCAAFPDQASRSQVVLIFHRAGGLTPEDHGLIAGLSRELAEEGRAAGEESWRVQSAALQPHLQMRLRSADREAEIVAIDLDVNFVTLRASQAVERIESMFEGRLPAGLTCEITGSAGVGRAHNLRSQKALQRTTNVTIIAVLVLLALVYRSPLGALVPLLSIGLSVYVAFLVLDYLAAFAGWSISNAERTFTVVLLFGAGTDYALFWISRYKEELSRGREPREAGIDAMASVGPAILASAATTIAGLSVLVAADMIITRNSGKVLGIVLTISLLAAMTLTPSLAYILGGAFFWPSRPNGRGTIGQRVIWPRLAADVVRRPVAVFACGFLTLLLPAMAALDLPIRYDTFDEVPEDSSAGRGLELARQHFSRDQLFPSRIMLKSEALSTPEQVEAATDAIAQRIAAVDGVTDVWHLGQPLGRKGGILAHLLTPFKNQVLSYYFSGDEHLLQFEVMQEHPPSGLAATTVLEEVIAGVESWARQNASGGFEVFALGSTPYAADVRHYASRDLRTILIGVTTIIFLIVLLFVRRFWLATFMIVATLITYAAALGLTDWVFVDLLGYPGIDYNIQIFVFVIIVAVGQDYNIFLVTRIRQESRSFDIDQAIIRSIVVTGPVISSCGLIMAATLGSIATTDAKMMQQLGFAFAMGILLDTFLVRPLLIPSFYLLMDRLRVRLVVPQAVTTER